VEGDSLAPHSFAARILSYFTAPEFAFIEAAVSRLIPAKSQLRRGLYAKGRE
jgi:hypothetical protein